MATVDVYFFQYSKKPASTAVPALNTGTKVECIFRDGYDILNPTLILDYRGLGDAYSPPTAWNYMYITDLNRYYWITDWSFGGGMWVCGGNVDLLGSHKTAIGSTYIFAQRLADRKKNNVVTDGGITDTMIPTQATPSYSRQRDTSPFEQSLSSGCYVIGVINDDANAAGSVSYYVLTPAGFKTFRSYLMGGTWLGATAEMSVDTQKAILNPIQYITSCMWFPIDISHIYDSATGVHGMNLGWWTIPSVGYWNITTSGMYRFHKNLTMPVHPQYSTTSQRMLKCAPFSVYQLHLPYFGTIPIDYEEFPSGTVGCFFEIDIISGKGSVQLYDGSITSVSDFPALKLAYQTSCQVATPIQLAQVVSDTWAAQVTQLQTAVSIASIGAQRTMQDIKIVSEAGKLGTDIGRLAGGDLKAIGDVFSGAVDTGVAIAEAEVHAKVLDAQEAATTEAGLYASFQAAAPRVTSQGANGSLLGSWCPLELSGRFLLLSETSSSLYSRIGYPAGWYTKIGDHSGYVQGTSADFYSNGALKVEMDAINSQIASGIYYE